MFRERLATFAHGRHALFGSCGNKGASCWLAHPCTFRDHKAGVMAVIARASVVAEVPAVRALATHGFLALDAGTIEWSNVFH